MDDEFISEPREPDGKDHRMPVADQRDGGQRCAVEQFVEARSGRVLQVAEPGDLCGRPSHGQSGMPALSGTTMANRSANAARLAACNAEAETACPSGPARDRVAVAAATTVGA